MPSDAHELEVAELVIDQERFRVAAYTYRFESPPVVHFDIRDKDGGMVLFKADIDIVVGFFITRLVRQLDQIIPGDSDGSQSEA